MRKLITLLGVLALAGLPAPAHPPYQNIDFYLAVDVPTDVPLPAASTTVLPWTLVRHRTAVVPDYDLSLLPAQPLPVPLPTGIDACHLLNGGDWLFSVEVPMDDPAGSGTLFLPGDLIRYDMTGLYTKEFCGTPMGIADGANVDAAFIRHRLDADGLVVQKDSGHLVLSFDVPTDIAGTTYMPADLVEFTRVGAGCAGWMVLGHYFNSMAAGVPQGANVTGADERGGTGTNGPHKILLTFDVPTDDPGGSGTTYLPGDLVAWDPAAGTFDAMPFHRDPNWPLPSGPPAGYSSRANAVCMLASPGTVPCTPASAKVHVKLGPVVGSLQINWSASCSVGVEDYGIHEGLIGTWYSHDDITCTDTGSDLMEVINPAAWASNNYYLVVPHNANDEGSYGQRTVPPLLPPAERPVSSPYPNCEANGTNMRELSCP